MFAFNFEVLQNTSRHPYHKELSELNPGIYFTLKLDNALLTLDSLCDSNSIETIAAQYLLKADK